MARNGRAIDRCGATSAQHGPSYGRGVVCVLAGGTCLSLGGVLIRQFETASGRQTIFYRVVGFIPALSVLLALKHRGRFFAAFLAVGWPSADLRQHENHIGRRRSSQAAVAAPIGWSLPFRVASQ